MTQRMSKTEKPVTSKSTSKAASKAANRKQMQENKTALKEAEAEIVWYESREKEPRQFDVAGIRSIRNFDNGRIEWEVPSADVERFEQNHFFRNGRVVRKAG